LQMIEPKVFETVRQNVRVASTSGGVEALVWPPLLRKLQRVNPGFDA